MDKNISTKSMSSEEQYQNMDLSGFLPNTLPERDDNIINEPKQPNQTIELKHLDSFLKQPGCFNPKKGDSATNIVNLNLGTCHIVRDPHIPEFFELLEKCRRLKLKTRMYEIQQKYSGIMLAFDVFQNTSECQFTEDVFITLCKNIISVVIDVVKFTNKKEIIHIAIIKKPAIQYNDNSGCFINEFYILIPGIQIMRPVKELIIQKIIENGNLENHLKSLNTNSAIESAFFLGSTQKPDDNPYELKYIFEMSVCLASGNIDSKIKRFDANVNLCYELSLNWGVYDGIIKKMKFEIADKYNTGLITNQPNQPNQVKLNSKVQVYKEKFDQHKLNHILQNKNIYKQQLTIKNDIDPFDMMTKYLTKSKKGIVEVSHFQHYGKGRKFASGGMSMANMCKKVRHTIGKDFYVDIDMVNAHPVILEFICISNNIPHTYLSDYIKNRDVRLQEMQVDRNEAKENYLKIINGKVGIYTLFECKKTINLESFSNEIANIRKALISLDKDGYKEHEKRKKKEGKKDNIDGSYMNILMCDVENRILHKMLEYFDNSENAVLCFDGIMLPNNREYDLRGCEIFIKKEIGIDMKLDIKPMDQGFDIIDPLQYVEIDRSFDSFGDWKDLLRHPRTVATTAATTATATTAPQGKYITSIAEVLKWAQNNIFEIDNKGKRLFYTKNREYQHTEKIYYDSHKEIIKIDLTEGLKKIVYLEKHEAEQFEKKNQKKAEQDNEPVEILLSDMIKFFSEHNMLRCYAQTLFIPYSITPPELPDAFNTFCGFHIKNYSAKKNINFIDTHIYQLITNGLCAGHKISEVWVLSWLAHMMQKPHEVPGTAIVFQSIQGTGKDMVGNFIRKMIGKNISDVYDNPDLFFSNFNSELSGLLFAVLNEITDKGETYKKHDLLKSFITREEVKVEAKFKDQYTRATYTRYAFFTNNDNAINVENSNRRFAMFRCNNDNAQNEVFFSKVKAEIDDPDVIRAAYDFFMAYDISTFNIRVPPDTDYQLEQKCYNMRNSYRFIKYLFDEKVVFENCSKEIFNRPRKGDYGISKDRLYDEYVKWCIVVKEQAVIRKNFQDYIKTFGIKDVIISQTGGLKFRGYLLSRESVLALFRVFLRNERFDFSDAEVIEEIEVDLEVIEDEENI